MSSVSFSSTHQRLFALELSAPRVLLLSAALSSRKTDTDAVCSGWLCYIQPSRESSQPKRFFWSVVPPFASSALKTRDVGPAEKIGRVYFGPRRLKYFFRYVAMERKSPGLRIFMTFSAIPVHVPAAGAIQIWQARGITAHIKKETGEKPRFVEPRVLVGAIRTTIFPVRGKDSGMARLPPREEKNNIRVCVDYRKLRSFPLGERIFFFG